jgi:predicted secreted protein
MDNRGNKIIYLSKCLLNQNLRFPGIAVESGVITELIEALIQQGIGIELLPCLERLGWGGIKRKTYFKYFPIVSKNVGTIKFPFIKLFLRIWIRNYKKVCKNEAKKIVHQLKDYIESGYSVLGIITTNDSPTCGYTRTINLLGLSSKYKELGLKDEFFENPTLELMKTLIPNLCENGSGYFISELKKLIIKSKLNINITGYDIWNNPSEETKKVINNLGLFS